MGEAGSAADALHRIPAARPDVALLDVRLPDGNGIDVCREIRSSHPEVKCLILTSFDDEEALFAAVMAGASGYLLKQIHGTDVIEGIRLVADGKSLIDPSVAGKLFRSSSDTSAGSGEGPVVTARARNPGTDHRRAHESADRRTALPRREDREELCVGAAGQVGDAASDRRRPRTALSGVSPTPQPTVRSRASDSTARNLGAWLRPWLFGQL